MSGEFPEVCYADAEGVSIAYEVRGNGPIDLVHVPGALGGLMAGMVDPVQGQFYDQLASFARLIRLDKRGTGMSDPLVAGGAPPLEQQVGDVLAVMDRVGSGRAALYSVVNSGQVAPASRSPNTANANSKASPANGRSSPSNHEVGLPQCPHNDAS